MDVKKYTMKGKESGKCNLTDEVFAAKIHPQTINEVVKAQLNNQRQGTVSSKTRAEVAGGGRKPWRQKGTGRARCGSNRSPIWVGGGSTFGPRPRIYDHRPPKKVVDRAVQGVLTRLAANDCICVVEKLSFDSGKTKDVRNLLKSLKLDRALFIVPEITEVISRAFSNLHNAKVVTPKNVNPVDLLRYGTKSVVKRAEGKERHVNGAVAIAEDALAALEKFAAGTKSEKPEVEKK